MIVVANSLVETPKSIVIFHMACFPLFSLADYVE